MVGTPREGWTTFQEPRTSLRFHSSNGAIIKVGMKCTQAIYTNTLVHRLVERASKEDMIREDRRLPSSDPLTGNLLILPLFPLGDLERLRLFPFHVHPF